MTGFAMRALAAALVVSLCCFRAAEAKGYVKGIIIENKITNLTDELTTSISDALTNASDAWTDVIRTSHDAITFEQEYSLQDYCDTDYTFAVDDEVHQLLVLVRIVYTDDRFNETGAYAQPCIFADTDGTYFPRVGVITLNAHLAAKRAVKGNLQWLLEHEIGHILGVGTLWDGFGLIEDGAYVGKRGIWGYLLAGGPEDATSVPLDSTSSTSGNTLNHWDEEVFDSELMTGTMDARQPPLSAVTVNSLRDIGYAVWPQNADDFELEDDDSSDRRALGSTTDLQYDFAPVDFSAVPVFADGSVSSKTITISSTVTSSASSASKATAWEIATTTTTVLLAVVLAVLSIVYVVRLRNRQVSSVETRSSIGSDPIAEKVEQEKQVPQAATLV